MTSPTRYLGLGSGIGLVMANMIGAGVLLSAGFMAQSMGPGPILLAWVLGTAVALCGVWSYAAIARRIESSGGEYRYLSDLLHPYLGHLAGWSSLILGFAAAIAVDALVLGEYLGTLGFEGSPRTLALGTLLLVTLFQALNLNWSKWSQAVLVAGKVILITLFVVLGIALGAKGLPTWEPPSGEGEFPVKAIFYNQFWIAFAFSGWNAAIYASGEFHNPKRDVPRAMLIGCGSVAVLYLLVNWVFVANFTPEMISEFAREHFSDDGDTRVTAAHLVARELLGEVGSQLAAAGFSLAFLSAMSAMTLVGPRVCSAMARDGFLPGVFAGQEGKPPTAAILLQTGLAAGMLLTHDLEAAVGSVGTVLIVFAALTALSLFPLYFRSSPADRPPVSSLVTAAIYAVSAVAILYFGFEYFGSRLWVVGLVVLISTAAYILARLQQRRTRSVAVDSPVSLGLEDSIPGLPPESRPQQPGRL